MSTSHGGLEHPQIQEPTEALDAIPWIPSDRHRCDGFKPDSAGNPREYMRVWLERVRLWLTEHVNGDLSQAHIGKRGSWKTHPTHRQSPHKVQPPRGHLAELQQCFSIQRTATERSQTRSQWAGKQPTPSQTQGRVRTQVFSSTGITWKYRVQLGMSFLRGSFCVHT